MSLMGNTFDNPVDTSLTDSISALLDSAIAKQAKEEYAKGRGSGAGDVAMKRLGSGYLGIECARQLAYKYHKFPEDGQQVEYVNKGELNRHAQAGFWTEEKTADWLRLCGFDLRTVNPTTGHQYGYKAARDAEGKARIAGELDGVILAAPICMPLPALWESKKATAKKFNKFVKEGVKAADPKYYGQMQANMTMMEVKHTLFSMLNLDTMKFYFEIIPFNSEDAQRIQDRAAMILSTESPDEVPRIARKEDDFRCKLCPYHSYCWKPAPVTNQTERPAWILPAP